MVHWIVAMGQILLLTNDALSGNETVQNADSAWENHLYGSPVRSSDKIIAQPQSDIIEKGDDTDEKSIQGYPLQPHNNSGARCSREQI